MQEVCTRLVLEAPCMFWPALLACAAPFSIVFLGSSSVFSTILPPPYARNMHQSCIGKFHVCFDLHFWLVLLHFPWFFLGPPVGFLQFCLLHMQEVCTSLVLESSMYVLIFTFGLCCSIFHGFSWVFQCIFYNFAWSCLDFCIVFPDGMVLRAGCAILVRHTSYARSMHQSCIGKFHVCFDLHFWLVTKASVS